MPMPRWWGQVNERVFDPWELRRGVRPVPTHVGRSSGRSYRTPLDAHALDGGDISAVASGSGSDWVSNVATARHARLTIDGEDVGLTTPRLVGDEEAWQVIGGSVRRPPRLLRIREYPGMGQASR